MRKTPPLEVAAGLVTLQRLPIGEALQRAQEMFPEYHFTTMTAPDGRTSPVMVPDAPTISYEVVPAVHRAGCPDPRAPVSLEVSAKAAVMHYDSGEPSGTWKSITACLQYHGVGYQDLRQNGAPLAFTPPEWLP